MNALENNIRLKQILKMNFFDKYACYKWTWFTNKFYTWTCFIIERIRNEHDFETNSTKERISSIHVLEINMIYKLYTWTCLSNARVKNEHCYNSGDE